MTTRRDWLLAASALPLAWARALLASGTVEKGVYRVRGDVRINGRPAVPGMDVKAGDVVATGPDGEAVFVVYRDAFLVRASSRVEMQGSAGALLVTGLRVVTGAILSVFPPGERKTIRTATATIGIRGTGIYVEAEPARTYVCTCYGEADLEPVDDPAERETVRTIHHDEPRYVMAKGMPQMIMKAPVVNHTDAELTLLEGLVGREPAFAGMGYKPY